jgi:hypothetical protein
MTTLTKNDPFWINVVFPTNLSICSPQGERMVSKHQRKRQLGLSKHRWAYNIKMTSREIGCEVLDSANSG